MRDQLEPITTADGSSSLSSKKFNATYHSIHGAMEESMHVFISAGLYHHASKGKTELSILEMGFGTGLNAYLSAMAAQKYELKLHYDTLEKFPIPADLVHELNFDFSTQVDALDSLKSLHDLSWNENHTINSYFDFHKHNIDIEAYSPSLNYDVIYFDAFAPSAQAHLWEAPLHEKLHLWLKPGGSLVTYCAQGKFKRMLKALGYTLEPLNGPGRKHEMTRATKSL